MVLVTLILSDWTDDSEDSSLKPSFGPAGADIHKSVLIRRHDSQNNDIQHNNTQHIEMTLGINYCYSECRTFYVYAGCRYAGRHDTQYNDIHHNGTQHNDVQHNNDENTTLSTMAEHCYDGCLLC